MSRNRGKPRQQREEAAKAHEPAINFTAWTAWGERETLRNAHLPGVYLLAQFDEKSAAQVDTLAREIIYVGETIDGSLLGRWQQFERAALHARPGHRGGMIFNERFGEDLAALYVAAYVPEGLSRELRPLYISYVHARLIWEWARRYGFEPLLNTK